MKCNPPSFSSKKCKKPLWLTSISNSRNRNGNSNLRHHCSPLFVFPLRGRRALLMSKGWESHADWQLELRLWPCKKNSLPKSTLPPRKVSRRNQVVNSISSLQTRSTWLGRSLIDCVRLMTRRTDCRTYKKRSQSSKASKSTLEWSTRVTLISSKKWSLNSLISARLSSNESAKPV